jgi:hypothetical protein
MAAKRSSRNKQGVTAMQAADDGEYTGAPTALIFADSDEARMRAGEAVWAMGGRVAAAMPIAGAAGRLADQIALDAVIVDADEGGAPLEALLDTILGGAARRRHTSVVSVSPALIDLAAARAWHSDVILLSNPSAEEQGAAIGAALAERRLLFADVKSEAEIPRLQQLSEEVGRIARMLASLSGEDGQGPRSFIPAHRAAPGAPADAMQVRAIIRQRRLRDQYFPAEMFADPAWDMLLDLTAAQLEGRAVAVSSLCIAAAVPPTTALRWIKQLTDAGLFVREADAKDGRRVFIRLSEDAMAAMQAYLAAALRGGGAIL